MSKLFKLKEWLTVPDAAKHLSNIFEEEVSEADVLRLALDGHLKLSVDFVNHTVAKRGQIVSWEDTDWFRGPPISKLPMENSKSFLNPGEAILDKALEYFNNISTNEKKEEEIRFEKEIIPKLEKLLAKLPETGKSFNEDEIEEILSKNEVVNKIIDELPRNDKFLTARQHEFSKLNKCVIKESPVKLSTLYDEMTTVDRLKEVLLQQQSCFMSSLMIDDERYLNIGKEIEYIEGIWDLSMFGGERLDVKHEYQQLTGGPVVTLETIDGCIVEKPDGQVCVLQNSLDDSEYNFGSSASLEVLKKKIKTQGLEKSEADTLLKKHEEARRKYLEERKSRPKESDYYPAGGLPHDSVLVVRSDALRELEDSMKETTEKPLSTTERRSLLTIIAALCDYSDIPCQERGAATQIARLTEDIGVPVSDDAIRRALDKIPDALEARRK